jgi:Ca2+-binding RTX toxin-like protein
MNMPTPPSQEVPPSLEPKPKKDGNDMMFGQVGNDSLWGGEGDDLLMGFTASNEAQQSMYAGQTDNDVLTGEGGNDTLSGGVGQDLLVRCANDNNWRKTA